MNLRVANDITGLGAPGALKTSRHMEGRTVLVVPAASLTTDPPPTHPAFFNPAASVNRDVAVALVAASGARTFCDGMAGVGSRGVRVANEVDGVRESVLVDINREALGLAERSAKLNRVLGKCAFRLSEVSSYFYSRFGRGAKFDCVDVDPFGSPARQIPGALSATADGGLLSVTATDTAALCGVYPKVALRRYGGTSVSNSFHHETGVRILVGALAREAASQEIGVQPVFAHATRHYIRATVRVSVGARRADESLGSIGYVMWCRHCGEVWQSRASAVSCVACGRKSTAAGPLWTGPLTDGALVKKAGEVAGRMGFEDGGKVIRRTEGVDGFPPWSFEIDEVCSALRRPTVPELSVIERLTEKGFKVMKQPFELRGVKTDAPRQEVVEAVRGAAGRKGI